MSVSELFLLCCLDSGHPSLSLIRRARVDYKHEQLRRSDRFLIGASKFETNQRAQSERGLVTQKCKYSATTSGLLGMAVGKTAQWEILPSKRYYLLSPYIIVFQTNATISNSYRGE